MKKILSIMLCVAMMFTVLSTSVFATDYVPAERSLDISANKTSVEFDDEVTISVIIDGDDIVNAEWDLAYNTTYFELISTTNYDSETENVSDTTGLLEKEHWILEGELDNEVVFTRGDAVKTYTFKALAQTSEVTGYFTISNQKAYTSYESIKPIDAQTDTNGSVGVTITLKEYDDVKYLVDGEEVAEDNKNINFDNEEHSFEITTDYPYEKITYEVNGVKVDSIDDIKDKGEYEIKYTITPEIGYDEISGTFTINIIEPYYEVEYVDNYVNGKTLVLVYTDVDNVWFTYNGDTMVDVTSSDYIYNEVNGAVYEHKHVYGYVADGIAGGTLADYEQNIADIYDDADLKTIEEYNFDVNNNGSVEIRDISSVYSVYNVIRTYFETDEFMVQILKADVNNDRCANNIDANLVRESYYPTV